MHIAGGISTPDCTWTYACTLPCTNAGGLAVAITIYDPNGLLVLNSTTNPSAAGYKEYAYDYVLSASAVPGTYSVAVSSSYPCGGGGLVFGQGTFQVIPTTACTTITVPWGISVSTDKSVYGPSDTVQITGSVSGGPSCSCPCGATCTCTFASNIIVELEIRNVIGTVVYSKALTLDPYSSIRPYSDSFGLSSALESGDYQVIARASYSGYPTVEANSSFQLQGTATTIAVTSPAITTPYAGGAVPGFQLESVFAGLLVGITVLMLFRRRSKQNDKHI